MASQSAMTGRQPWHGVCRLLALARHPGRQVAAGRFKVGGQVASVEVGRTPRRKDLNFRLRGWGGGVRAGGAGVKVGEARKRAEMTVHRVSVKGQGTWLLYTLLLAHQKHAITYTLEKNRT